MGLIQFYTEASHMTYGIFYEIIFKVDNIIKV